MKHLQKRGSSGELFNWSYTAKNTLREFSVRERCFPSASYCLWQDNWIQIGSYATVPNHWQLISEGSPLFRMRLFPRWTCEKPCSLDIWTTGSAKWYKNVGFVSWYFEGFTTGLSKRKKKVAVTLTAAGKRTGKTLLKSQFIIFNNLFLKLVPAYECRLQCVCLKTQVSLKESTLCPYCVSF